MAISAAPPAGTDFVFYVPKSHMSGKIFPAKKQKDPSNFIKSKFKTTTAVPFGTKGMLAKTKYVHAAALLAASLECGYGRRAHWTCRLMLNRAKCAELSQYLRARLSLVHTCVERYGWSWTPRGFYEKVEASEKVTVSFISGGMGAYLAALEWARAAGTSVKAFLHVGIYAKCSAGLRPLVTSSYSTGKSPDFLVETYSNDWHVFEAKGGRHGSRWSRICEGLTQLKSLPRIGWATSGTSALAETSVCVHTSIDSGERLSITAVDPPDVVPGAGESFVLIEGSCELFLALEAIQAFNSLVEGSTFDDPNLFGWTFTKTSFFDDLSVAIPTRCLKSETTIRQSLAVFLAVREYLERMSPRTNPASFGTRLRAAVRGRLRRPYADDTLLDVDDTWLGAAFEQFPTEYIPDREPVLKAACAC